MILYHLNYGHFKDFREANAKASKMRRSGADVYVVDCSSFYTLRLFTSFKRQHVDWKAERLNGRGDIWISESDTEKEA